MWFKKFSINKLSGNIKTKFCFRCTKHNCKRIYPLRQNSFYDKFKFLTFDECHEIFKCFIINNFNAKETVQFLSENRKINTTEATVRIFFTEIRKFIYLYYNIQYNTEPLGEENKYENYSVDESIFCHYVNKDQLWVLGM